jgi:transposase
MNRPLAPIPVPFFPKPVVADAQKVKGLAPLACKTDKIDARVLAELSWRDLVAVWLPDQSIRRERELARYRLHLVRHGRRRSATAITELASGRGIAELTLISGW